MTIKGMAASPLTTHSITQHVGKYFAVLQKFPIERWRQVSIVGLSFWLCHSLAQLFWLVMPQPELPPPAPVTAAAAANQTASPAGMDIAALKSLNLFGKASAEQKNAVAQQPQIDATVDTRLNLILRGIIGSNSAEASRAIIAEGSKQALYGVGDELPAGRGVKLAKVLEQRVILDNNGRFESLWLFTEDDKAPSSRRRSARDRVASRPTRREPPPRVVAQQSQQSLTDVMKVSIVRESGKVVGYRIRPGRNREMFNNLGLKANDVVTSVNGITLDSSSKAMEVYKSMKGKTTAQLELRRGDETMSVNVDLSGEG